MGVTSCNCFQPGWNFWEQHHSTCSMCSIILYYCTKWSTKCLLQI